MPSQSEYLTQEQICEENAKILIYKSKKFCKILNLPYKKKNVLSTSKLRKKRCPSMPDKRKNLVGFYIKPTMPLSDLNNQISLLPVWIVEDFYGYADHIGVPIIFDHTDIGQSPPNLDPCGAHIIGLNPSVTLNGFNHNDLQFSDYTQNGFDRTFISRYELFCLVQNAKYIGIVGTRISSGNIIAMDTSNVTQVVHDCNVDYFTYRLIGLNSFKCLQPGPGPHPKVYHKSNYRKSDKSFNHSEPGETWSTPCPPRWV